MDEEKVKVIEEFQVGYLNLLIEDIVKDMNIVDHKSSPLSPIVPKEVIENEAKDYFKDRLDDIDTKQKIKKGINIIVENLKDVPEEKMCKQELENGAKKYMEFFALLTDLYDDDFFKKEDKELRKPDSEGNNLPASFPSMAEGFGISPASFEIFYKIGCKLYEQKQFEEAICVFQVLTFLDGYNKAVWIALGMGYQIQANYQEAIPAYVTAMMLNPEDPIIYIYIAECFLELGDISNTKANLDLAQYFNSINKVSQIEERIESLRKLC